MRIKRIFLLIALLSLYSTNFAQLLQKNTDSVGSKASNSKKYAANSVLKSGNWYKIGLKNTGIYKITYNDLVAMGINPPNINPKNIRIYGNGGGMLPEANSSFRFDDLHENAIFVSGEDDGTFDTKDYILFYGQSPNTWKYNPQTSRFEHSLNIYSDYTYYFITTDLGEGKRIESLSSSELPATETVTQFNDYAFHEQDNINVTRSGKIWLGETFDALTTYHFPFTFADIDPTFPVVLTANVAAFSSVSSNFSISVNNVSSNKLYLSLDQVADIYTMATGSFGTKNFSSTGPSIDVKVEYSKPSSTSKGWLNYLELNVVRNLNFSGGQMNFRNTSSVGQNKVAEFILSNATSNVTVWDVTANGNPKKAETTLSNNQLHFRWPSDTLHEFIAFDGSTFMTTEFIEKVENQNLHAIAPTDLVIISHPAFLDEAYRLATFHASNDNMSVTVTTPQKIYNEFSSGAQDISGIRDFIKMLWDKGAQVNGPHYLLLLGDGSYDYKNRMANNTNFIPSFQSQSSYVDAYSYVSDDFFGFLDDYEGTGHNDLIDIGIGRLPAKTLQEATDMVDKIIYYNTEQKSKGDWRNVICLVADDENDNIHLEHAEKLASLVDTTYATYNIDKIYLDAYPKVSTPGGSRFPDVNTAINKRVDKGCLIMNYTGHGGEVGWALERVLEISDIESWKNINNMPVFVTATCEFSRFDDPERTSAGEMVCLKPNAGAIAMFTTTRPTYGYPNSKLNQSFFKYALKKDNSGGYLKMGDVIRLSKRENISDGNNERRFILLGDPALSIAFPRLNILTDSVTTYGELTDTLKALANVQIYGSIHELSGEKATSFNGTVYMEVFDKPENITTLESNGGLNATFQLQKSVLYKGKAQVVNGNFSFNFIVPKDIAYQYGNGKLSYYASSSTLDASGYDKSIIIGGMSKNILNDNEGPNIHLFMNDQKFVNGQTTDENPVLLALVSDSIGINTIGNGIGHDIVAVIDGDTESPMILNDFYEANLNTYKSGVIRYPLSGLSEGNHTLQIKVWDVCNNSSTSSIDFEVVKSSKFIINQVYNYPNPMSEATTFAFVHNQSGKEMNVKIDIFSIDGRLQRNIQKNIATEGYRTDIIGWDGNDSHGNRLRQGIYIFRVTLRTTDGLTAEKTGKLVIIH